MNRTNNGINGFDLVVIGAGIVGLSQAYEAARAGRSVCVIDESPAPFGASVRNFGMVWPIGLPLGPWHDLALASRAWWLTQAERFDLWTNRAGSLFLAGDELEAAVMREFVEAEADHRQGLVWLERDELRRDWPELIHDDTQGGLACGEELGLDPPSALQALWSAVRDEPNITLRTATQAESVSTGVVRLAGGETVRATQILVCSGHAWERFFPGTYTKAGVKTCKLQMLALEDRSSPGPPHANAATPPMLATGLTLRHYPAFVGCPSLPGLRERIARTEPELDHWAIHLLAAPRHETDPDTGQTRRVWIVGDSHEYGQDPYTLEEAPGSLIADGWAKRCPAMGRVLRRWLGFYAKQDGAYFFAQTPEPGVACLHNVCGLGMTLSPGLAVRTWENYDGNVTAALRGLDDGDADQTHEHPNPSTAKPTALAEPADASVA